MPATVVDDLYFAHMARLALERVETERVAALTGIYANSNLDGEARVKAIAQLTENATRTREALIYKIEHPEEQLQPVEELWWKKKPQVEGEAAG
jgi:hypothetical protein